MPAINILAIPTLLPPPDYREERDGLVLLVWGDVPYWTVVDAEFDAVVQAMAGGRLAEEVIGTGPERREVLAQVRALCRALAPKKQAPAGAPLYGTRIESVAINITRRCNLRCRFCYNLPHLTNDGSSELSAVEMIAFLRTLRPFLGRQPILTLMGGEPLLEPDKLLAVAEQGRRQHFTVLVSTNGTRVTEAFARQAAATGLQVQVSLDGPTATLHESVRGAGAYRQTLAGIETLVRHGAHTIVSMVCHRGNLAALEDFYRLALELDVREARFIPLKCLGGATDGAFTPVPMAEMLRHAFVLFTRHPEFLPLTGRDAFAIQANTCRYSTRRASCGTGLQTVLLDADGALYPCLNTNQPEFRIANLRDAGFDFRRTWLTSPVLQELRRRTVLHQPGHDHATCPVRYWCLGGCRGENHTLTGALDKRPPHCTELRRGIIEIFWMLAERPDLVKPSVKSC